MSDRNQPTSFQVGPPSPSSPPAILLKERNPPFFSPDQIPRSPTSPPLMSVSSQNYATDFASSHASPRQATTSQSLNPSSPPSSVQMSAQVSQQSLSATNSFPTPASSVSGHVVSATSLDDPENVEKSIQAKHQEPATTAATGVAVEQTQEARHRGTDHDQSWGGSDPYIGTHGSGNLNSSGADKKNVDAMEVDNDTVPAESNRDELSLDSLQKDFTSAFHLCKSSHPPTGPDPSLDLVSLYGLGPVAKSVARMDPVTGEKINRLRKSYEGKLKGLGLAGRNKPVKRELGAPGGLRHLTMWPDEEWQNQKVSGKDIKVADVDSALYAMQTRAMKLEPGAVPNNEYWEDVLGLEKSSKHLGDGEPGKKMAPTPGTSRPGGGQSNGTPVAAEPERTRPSRGRKRNYDDSSFAGYGEGFADDDDDDDSAFYLNSDSLGKKKRKKV